MESDRVVTKSQRLAELLYKMAAGAANLNDRLEMEGIVVRCDGPTFAVAKELARWMRECETRPVRFAPVLRFAA